MTTIAARTNSSVAAAPSLPLPVNCPPDPARPHSFRSLSLVCSRHSLFIISCRQLTASLAVTLAHKANRIDTHTHPNTLTHAHTHVHIQTHTHSLTHTASELSSTASSGRLRSPRSARRVRLQFVYFENKRHPFRPWHWVTDPPRA